MDDSVWDGRTLGVIGGGNMAEALVRGVLSAALVPAGAVVVYDPLPERLAVFSQLGCLAATSPREVLAADVVLLATKPQVLHQAVEEFGGEARKDSLFVSIAAGINAGSIEGMLPAGCRVIRVMPNTPLLVGGGVSALARGSAATTGDMRLGLKLFACAGTAIEVEEKDLDAVTALSGSGPAYLFRFAEALIAGGEALGLAPELAKELTIGMLKGSAEMLARFREPAPLRERVTSPGGTTAAALKVFEERDFAGMVAAALAAANDRSIELGRQQ